MTSFYVENFGCRATQADGSALEQQLLGRGMARAMTADEAEVVVLNTCTVTHAADQDVRNSIRRIHRENPGAQILVTGCYAQRAPEDIARIEGVTWVVGNSHKHQIADLFYPSTIGAAKAGSSKGFVPLAEVGAASMVAAAPGDKAAPPMVLVGDIFAHTELLAAPVFEGGGKTRPNLKVQDGCNNRCSFCIIPSVRGQSRSLKLDEVVREVDGLVAAGYREIVLSGINLGRWGREFERPLPFVGLLRTVLERTTIERIRISSVEPMDWSDELIEVVAGSPRIAKHAHVPLQSGSDRVLRLMHRRYRPWHYEEKIRKIHAAMPHAAIGADVMAGFPGETAELFEESRSFIEALPFTYLHVFTFSARPGTPGATMPGQVPPPVMKERNRVLREMAARKNRAFRESFVGRELPAITLTGRDGDCTEALSDNYLKLSVRGQHAANLLMQARIEALTADGLLACAQEIRSGGSGGARLGQALRMV